MKLAIDASRCRSGGAERHLAGILNNIIIGDTSFKSILVWIPQSFSEELPSAEWLEIRHPDLIIDNLAGELWWQAFSLRSLLKRCEVDVLLTADASSLCRFYPTVVISQDLSAFEPEVLRSATGIGFLRLLIIKWIQIFAIRRASACIYQSSYAQRVINREVKSSKESSVIAHGVGNIKWRWAPENFLLKKPGIDKYNCIYVSPISHYKKQLELVKAIRRCQWEGLNLSLELIGGGSGDYYDQVVREVDVARHEGCDIILTGFVKHEQVLMKMSNADIFIFPSICETFGITLAEAMYIGVPVICANASSLPDLLQDGGVYFDSDCPFSIIQAIRMVVTNPMDTVNRALLARQIAQKLNWRKASIDTFELIERCVERSQRNNIK